MRVKVEYSAQARQATGVREELVELAGASLYDLLLQLSQKYGDPFRRIALNEDSEPHPAPLIFVNDEHIAPGTNPKLKDGDAVSIVSPMSGG